MPSNAGSWCQYERHLVVNPNSSPWRPFDCEFTYQFLAGVRVLITFVSAPKAGQRLRSELEERMGLPPGSIPSGNSGRQAFDLEPIKRRWISLNAVGTILTDWPSNFLKTMRDARVWASHFTQVEQEFPYWLRRVIEDGLSAPRYRPNAKEVEAAKRAMERTESPITRLGISRLLGTRDGVALDEEFGRYRRRHTREEATAFFLCAVRALATVPTARSERKVATRNIYMLLMSAVSAASIEELCKLRARDIPMDFSSTPLELAQFAKTASKEFRSTRADDERLFLSRFGTPLVGASIRLFASRLLEKHAVQGVWRSADALRGVFTS